MTPASKMDFKKIKEAINSLSRDDRKTRLTTKVGDNPTNVDNVLTLIEDLCAVIRRQEGESKWAARQLNKHGING